jgi:hypothetical protein
MLSSRPSRQTGPGRTPSLFDRFATLAGGGPILMMSARFGRSPVREAANRLRAQHRHLDLKLSWRLFAGLADWGERWPAEQDNFAAGLILSAARDPVVERTVGRCLADLARLGKPLPWGVVSERIRWYPRFMLSPNGWTPEELLPHPATYVRLAVAHDGAEFRPQFDPVLCPAHQDFLLLGSRLRWLDARFGQWCHA